MNQFPIPVSEVDSVLGEIALSNSFFSQSPSRVELQKAGHKWFKERIFEVKRFLEENPEVVAFFSADNSTRNEILAIIGDVVIFTTVDSPPIPTLVLLSKIFHFGIQRIQTYDSSQSNLEPEGGVEGDPENSDFSSADSKEPDMD